MAVDEMAARREVLEQLEIQLASRTTPVSVGDAVQAWVLCAAGYGSGRA